LNLLKAIRTLIFFKSFCRDLFEKKATLLKSEEKKLFETLCSEEAGVIQLLWDQFRLGEEKNINFETPSELVTARFIKEHISTKEEYLTFDSQKEQAIQLKKDGLLLLTEIWAEYEPKVGKAVFQNIIRNEKKQLLRLLSH